MVLRCAWVLGLALMAPVALPAGGADLRHPDPRRRGPSGPLLSGGRDQLKSSPASQAPSLLTLGRETPMTVLRHWNSPDGRRWAYVQVLTGSGLGVGQVHKRGWVNV